MSENYQYAECKHCGKSIMELEIHNCRQMLLAEIEELNEKLAAVCFERNLAQIDVHRLEAALEKIARASLEPGHLYNQAVRMQIIANEALADRP